MPAGDGAQRQEGHDLVKVLGKTELAATQPIHTQDGQARSADALDARAQLREEGAELLHVRLRGGMRAAVYDEMGHVRVGGGNRRTVVRRREAPTKRVNSA